MSDIPSELRYSESHEWVSEEEDGVVKVGITDHAQEQLGDLVFVELPEDGASFSQGDACAVVESVKAASDLYMPLHAEVLEINEEVDSEPELLNSDPYGKGWLLKVRFKDASQIEELLKADAYSELI